MKKLVKEILEVLQSDLKNSHDVYSKLNHEYPASDFEKAFLYLEGKKCLELSEEKGFQNFPKLKITPVGIDAYENLKNEKEEIKEVKIEKKSDLKETAEKIESVVSIFTNLKMVALAIGAVLTVGGGAATMNENFRASIVNGIKGPVVSQSLVNSDTKKEEIEKLKSQIEKEALNNKKIIQKQFEELNQKKQELLEKEIQIKSEEERIKIEAEREELEKLKIEIEEKKVKQKQEIQEELKKLEQLKSKEIKKPVTLEKEIFEEKTQEVKKDSFQEKIDNFENQNLNEEKLNLPEKKGEINFSYIEEFKESLFISGLKDLKAFNEYFNGRLQKDFENRTINKETYNEIKNYYGYLSNDFKTHLEEERVFQEEQEKMENFESQEFIEENPKEIGEKIENYYKEEEILVDRDYISKFKEYFLGMNFSSEKEFLDKFNEEISYDLENQIINRETEKELRTHTDWLMGETVRFEENLEINQENSEYEYDDEAIEDLHVLIYELEQDFFNGEVSAADANKKVQEQTFQYFEEKRLNEENKIYFLEKARSIFQD